MKHPLLRCVRLVAWCTLAPALASAQQLQGKVWIGDGITSQGTYNGTTHQPFQQALADLALTSAGWQIEVLPGEYTFGATVDVTLPGVRIYGSRAAVLKPAPAMAAVPMLQIGGGASGFALEGLTLKETRPNAAELVRILAPDAAVSGCAFHALSGVSPGTGHLLSFGDGVQSIEGGMVLGNSFLFHGTVAGRVGLRARGCRGLAVLANEFRPFDVALGAATVRAAIELEDSPGAAVRANVFASLASTGASNALLACASTAEAEGGRMALSANVFGDVSGTAIVRLDNVDACTVGGNVFGRKDVPGEVLRISGGAGNAVTGNQFHDAGSLGATCVRGVGSSALVVSANSFLDSKGPQVRLEAVSGANVFGNRFSQAPGLMINFAAIHVDGLCAAIVVGANAARGAAFFHVYSGPASAVTEFLSLFP